MDLKELSYLLYMENKELESKEYKNLTEYEKVNMKLNPFLDENTVTTHEKSQKMYNYPKNIPPSIIINDNDI